MKVREYPSRVKRLEAKLAEMNGGKLTAEESRALIKLLGETQLDMWDMVILLTCSIDTWMSNVKKVTYAILGTVCAGLVLWISTDLIPQVIAHIGDVVK